MLFLYNAIYVNINIKAVLVISSLVVLASAGAGVWWYINARNSSPTDNINYGAPTEEEKTAGDRHKEEIIDNEKKQNEAQKDNSSQKKTATVIITDAGQYDGIIEVRSFIPDHYQNGTCTVTFEKDGQTVIRETPARTDVSTTICMNPLIKRSAFPSAGAWQVTVSYDSEGASGRSEAQTININ